MTAIEQADKLLDDTALLMYGVKYQTLDHIKAGLVMREVMLHFDSKLIDVIDAEEDTCQ